MKPMSQRQAELYHLIEKLTEEQGFPPTIREISQGLGGRSISTVKFHLDRMAEAGYLTMEPGKSRSIRLCNHGHTLSPRQKNQIPILGNVAAGLPILAEEVWDEYLTFDTQGTQGEHFALRVRGESMRDVAILPGDCVVVRRQEEAYSGQIVVALFQDEATVKTLRYQGDTPWLMPANPDFEPIDGTQAQILGRVVAVVRHY